MRALWLPERLRAFGVTVVEHEGWRDRGGSGFDPRAVVIHHTAGPAAGDAPSLNVCIVGRPDLPGPLCHVLLARSGTAHVIASGRANHAGAGGWRGVNGNTHALGIEAENTGIGEPWPAVQLEAFRRCSAAFLAGIGRDASWVCAHREWTPRKIDPTGIDMDRFRDGVGHLLTTPRPAPGPARKDHDMPILARQAGTPAVYLFFGRANYVPIEGDDLAELEGRYGKTIDLGPPVFKMWTGEVKP